MFGLTIRPSDAKGSILVDMKTTRVLFVFLAVANIANQPAFLVNDGTALGANNKAAELSAKGDYYGARAYIDAAIRREPKSYFLYMNRASLFISTNQWQLALQDLDSCVRLNPAYLAGFDVRAFVHERLGEFRSSLADYNLVLRVNRSDWMALNGRASLRATCLDSSIRNGQEAVSDARKVCNITNWKIAGFIDTLASAYAETGDFASAVQYQQNAITLSPNKDIEGMRERLALYQSHKPYRTPLSRAARDHK